MLLKTERQEFQREKQFTEEGQYKYVQGTVVNQCHCRAVFMAENDGK